MADLDDLIDKYEKIYNECDQTILQVLETTAIVTVDEYIKPETPVDTGKLRHEMKYWKPEQNGNNYSVEVGNDSTEYCPYIEYGFTKRNGSWYTGKFMITNGADKGRKLLSDILKDKWGGLFNDK